MPHFVASMIGLSAHIEADSMEEAEGKLREAVASMGAQPIEHHAANGVTLLGWPDAFEDEANFTMDGV